MRPFDTTVKVKLTNAGPRLHIGNLEVRKWNGVVYNDEAQRLAKSIRRTIDHRLVALGLVNPSPDPSKDSYGYSR